MIRPAVRSDTKAIARLIRALAEFERLTHAVVFDENRLEEHLFGPRPFAEVLVAEEGGEVVGFALFFPTYSTFQGRPGIYLEDLFVQSEYRGKGIGKELLTTLARLAIERGCARLEWTVLNWNESAIAFYRSLGAVSLHEWQIYRLSGDALTAAAKSSG
jgi:GNAT superfamily N-acetyltransferase